MNKEEIIQKADLRKSLQELIDVKNITVEIRKSVDS